MAATSPLALLLSVLAVLDATSACLITNCPRGGKRASLGAAKSAECVPCGPGGEGLCVGPGICCSPLSGCLLSSRGVCSRVAAVSPSCVLAVSRGGARSSARAAAVPLDAPCGSDLTPDGSAPGRCAADGVCCARDSCRMDAVCSSADASNELPEPALEADVLAALRRMEASSRGSK